MAIQVNYFPTNEPFNNWSYHPVTTGRPEWRKDYRRGMTENFTFDNLERLKTYQNGSVSYDVKGNITLKSDAGNLYYNDPAKPYSITSQSNSPLPVRVQNISYTSFQRPLAIEENGCRADFVYGPGHNRVNMKLKTSPTTEFMRYYVAGCYEKDVNTLGAPGTTERLYIGGDAYSAPAVYIRANSGAWQLHYLHRDVQGSITNITNSSGAEVAEYSYTAWGRMRNPINWTAYAPGTEPALLTGRGYTGHEHLNMFRLINMNARLYDPVLGRMLSPDNYVQSPDFSQNFNRYAYCLNNPVMYTDLSGDRFAIAPGEQDLYINDTALDYRRMIGYGGPGSGNYWSDSFRSVTGNYMLMSSGTFDQTYGNGSYDMVYNNITFNNSTSGDHLFRHIATSPGYSTGIMVDGFKLNGVIYEFSGPVPYLNIVNQFNHTVQEDGLLDKGLGYAGKINDAVGAFAKTLTENGLTAVMVNGGKTIGRYSGPAGIVINAGQVFNGVRKDGYTYGFNAKKATAGAVGGIAGAWTGFQVGAWAGFEVGFSIGLCFEGVGAIPGAIIGGIAGGFGGALGGAYGGGKLGESLISNKVQ